ncbi:MAG: hypothetical protein K1000chlam3_00373 [Chlamydiae bacterium]|nr:hypothetical protein [Chlamydiota bacterium]
MQSNSPFVTLHSHFVEPSSLHKPLRSHFVELNFYSSTYKNKSNSNGYAVKLTICHISLTFCRTFLTPQTIALTFCRTFLTPQTIALTFCRAQFL